jgi:subtilisin family serine protease
MKSKMKLLIAITCAGMILSTNLVAQGKGNSGGKASSSDESSTLQSWMAPEIQDAWSQGYKGQGITITVVDDFKSTSRFNGNLGSGSESLTHGQWTLKEASMIAPSASMKSHDFSSTASVKLSRGINVLNLSYGMFAQSGYTADQIRWSARENSIIDYAKKGTAVVAKAAGNDFGTAIGEANQNGQVDYLNLALRGASSAIYVGALNTNGTTLSPASIANYSNIAGTDQVVQSQFLVVGVEGYKTGLYGTSFAAPIVSGYAAIIGSKFTKATPAEISNQLLNTARTDTISNYDSQIHGRGEASLSRALAPVAIR